MKIQEHINPGELVAVVPVGLHITLQYNTAGNLFKVYLGFDKHKDVTDEIMMKLIDEKTVPQPIKITGGSTYVYGVLYTSEIVRVSAGTMDDPALYDELYDLYRRKSAQFNFFAASIYSESVPIHNARSVRNQLTVNNFRLLPTFLTPAKPTNEYFMQWIFHNMTAFHHKIPACYAVIGTTTTFVNADCKQYLVTQIIPYTDDYGYVKVNIGTRTVDYSDYVRLGIKIGSVLMFDADNNIVQCEYADSSKISPIITCGCCGKRYTVPSIGRVMCDNAGCMSKSLGVVQNMLNRFGLDELEYGDSYQDFIKENNILSALDILDYYEYSDAEIHTTIADVLRAFVPIAIVRNNELFTIIANACNNTVNTVSFYLAHPDRLKSDFGLIHPELPAFMKWISVPANLSDISSALSHPRIFIDGKTKRFDGVPAFRDKTIYITGNFIHGNLEDITAILQSYSATVTTDFNSGTVDWVVTGGRNEGINGSAIRAARAAGIPVYDEISFFQHYDIDTDIKYASGVI